MYLNMVHLVLYIGMLAALCVVVNERGRSHVMTLHGSGHWSLPNGGICAAPNFPSCRVSP